MRGKRGSPSVTVDGEKVCSLCLVKRPAAMFRADLRRRDGRVGFCKICRPITHGSRESPEKLAARWAIYGKSDRLRQLKREQRRRERSTVVGRLNHRISRGVWESLRSGKTGRSWRDLVGYTTEDLRAHLESLFAPGMGWHNFGQWHIDHRRPLASFAFSTADDPQFREAWALTNLQPLWALDNIRKGSRYAGEAMDAQRACG